MLRSIILALLGLTACIVTSLPAPTQNLSDTQVPAPRWPHPKASCQFEEGLKYRTWRLVLPRDREVNINAEPAGALHDLLFHVNIYSCRPIEGTWLVKTDDALGTAWVQFETDYRECDLFLMHDLVWRGTKKTTKVECTLGFTGSFGPGYGEGDGDAMVE